MFKNLKLGPKLLTIGIALTVIPLLVVGFSNLLQFDKIKKTAKEESLKLVYEDLDHVVENVYQMAKSRDEVLQESVNNYLNVSREVLNSTGQVVSSKYTVSWDAVNQYNKAVTKVTLPKFMVGGKWLGQVSDLKISVPVVDKVKDLTGMTCTIFQRMNQNGDMLRVATNVEKKDGTRAIGTYIPRINPDGTANPVISTVLKGQTFKGRAYVVNAWYTTAYEPIYDANKNVVGVLYVGVPQVTATALKNAIYNIKIGKTGYVYVLDTKGRYIISKDGKRDGEDISQAKDANGNLFIQELVRKGMAAKGDDYGELRYAWKNIGESEARMKIARLKYFEPWGWVIGAGSYEEEIFEGPLKIEAAATQATTISLIVGLIAILAAAGVWLLTSRGITGPIVKISEVIRKISQERDLTLQVPASGKDEVGIMASEFNTMSRELRNAFGVVDKSAATVAQNSSQVAQRATANQERAGNEQKRAEQVQTTVAEMGTTAAEVAGYSQEQRESAEQSSASLNILVQELTGSAEKTIAQVQEANTAAEKVVAMGETGGKVVATAAQQAEEIARVTEAVQQMTEAMNEMNQAALRSTEHGKSVLKAADEGIQSVSSTVQGMEAIKESSDQISEIISVITEIAEQTNLLALNATIEAARAGVHGKGFAVVADEVGKLAQRSSEAAKEITQLIKDSTARVDEGASLTDQSQQALQRIAQGGQVNMEAIEEIAETSQKLSVNTREVNQKMTELNTLAAEIGGMAGQQGGRREAAQKALNQLVAKSRSVAQQITEASSLAQDIGKQMQEVVGRSENMQELTGLQATRSQRLVQIATESAEGAKQTLTGAGEVVKITNDLEMVSKGLTEQVAQFKIS